MNIEQINEEFNKLQLNEMSLAWDYRKRNFSVCVWTEGPMNADNRYFKYYDNESPDNATKVAGIRIDRCEYVGGNYNEYNSIGKLDTWVLNEKDKKIFVKLMNSPSDDNDGCTKWQDIIIRWNRDNFGIPAKKTISGDVNGYKAKPGITAKEPFPIDYPMPNYLKLGE